MSGVRRSVNGRFGRYCRLKLNAANYSRSLPAISACQGATRRSTKPIRLLSPIAITIRMMIGTNMVAVSKLLAELMITAPRPEMVVKNSAITMATTARPTASRTPAMI